MSLASDFVKKVEEANTAVKALELQRPTITMVNGDTATVTSDGKLDLDNMTEELTPEQALALAKWILMVFTDVPKPSTDHMYPDEPIFADT